MEACGEKEDEGGGAEQSFPIMHWEELSARIEELERQERNITGAALRAVWYDDDDDDDEEQEKRKRRRSSRFQKNLQLCFYNDGDSEDEGGANGKCCGGSGLKQEVVLTLRKLRDKRLDKLRRENSEQSQSGSRSWSWSGSGMSPLLRSELELRPNLDLQSLRSDLQKEAHGLSSVLVSVLLVRDQLRTEQEALLLDLLDLT